MSDPLDIGFGVPPVYTGEWPPPSWADALTQHPALQPGLGVPPSVADAALSVPPQSDMVPDAQHLAAAGGASPYSQAVAPPPMPNDQPGGLETPSQIPETGPSALSVLQPLQPPPMPQAAGPAAPTLTELLNPTMDKRDPLSVTQEDHDAAVEAESDRLANDPMALALAQQRQQELRDAEEHKAKLADNVTAIKNLQNHIDADAETKKQSDQVLADAWALSHSKVDPEQWMKSRSAPQTIAAVIASVLGGFVAPQNGGRNVGMDIINKAIEDNIAAQKDNIANGWKGLEMRKGAIADKRSADLASFNNAEAMRQATYQYAVNQIDDKIAALDPNSARAAKLGALKAQVMSAAAASHNAFVQQTFKNNLEIAKVRQEEIKQADERADRKVKNSIAYGQLAETKREHDMADVARRDALEAKRSEATDKRSEKADADEAKSVRNPVTGSVLTDDNGVPLKRGSAELADKMNESIGTAQNFIDAASEARRMLEKDPSLVDRQEWARVTTNLENAKVAFIEKHGAKASSREMEAMSEVMGPNFEHFASRVKDKGTGKARLDTLIDTVDRETLTELKTKLGYKGASPLLKTNKPGEATPTETDKLNEVLSTNYMQRPMSEMSDDDIAWTKARAAMGGPGSQTDKLEGEQILKSPSPLVARSVQAGIPPSMVQAFDELRAKATSTDKTASEHAFGVLLEQAKNGSHATIRDYAGAVLKSIADQSIGDAPPTGPANPDFKGTP